MFIEDARIAIARISDQFAGNRIGFVSANAPPAQHNVIELHPSPLILFVSPAALRKARH